MVYAIASIGILGFIVWSHHMYAVGLDVDTSRVSFLNVSLVIIIWLYAGNFLFVCPDFVDGKIKQICTNTDNIGTKKQSAGNLQVTENGEMSENEKISEHTKHNKPKSDEDLGYYLSGLIEGDGHLSRRGFEIIFHEKDVQNAYYIKNIIGYGSISKVKNKKAYKLSITNQAGRRKVWSLINGKLQGPYKIEQAIKHRYDTKFNCIILPEDNSYILKTFWLAGFADADGSFQIFIRNSKTHKLGKNVTLVFRITQKYPELINKISRALNGGTIFKSLSDDCYRYSTVSFSRAIFRANYFDNFSLQNNQKWLRYCYWKKALLLVQNKEHLTVKGLEKMIDLKMKINKLQ